MKTLLETALAIALEREFSGYYFRVMEAPGTILIRAVSAARRDTFLDIVISRVLMDSYLNEPYGFVSSSIIVSFKEHNY